MIKELTRELVALIHQDYPDLEELNLSSNGKYDFFKVFCLMIRFFVILEISIVQNLDFFSRSMMKLNLSSNQIRSLSSAHLTLSQSQ